MCKKSHERKYLYYDIKIINNLDNSIENINIYNKKKINKSDYKEMLDAYRNIKNRYKDQNVTIDFCGISDDSTITVMWKKELNIYNNRNNIYNLLEQLNLVVKQIINRNEYVFTSQGIYDSKEQKELHKIEDMERKNKYEMSQEDIDKRLEIFNNIQSNRIDRRYIKEEKNVLKAIKGRGMLTSLININRDIQKSKVIINKKNFDTRVKCHTNPEKMAENLYKEIPYENFEDRNKIMKELQRKYKNVIYDKERKICIGRNKIYQ